MRVVAIAGVVLAALGAFGLLKGFSYTREQSVFKFGDVEAKVQREQQLPEWISGVALGAGVVLIVVGLKRR
jgi:hypothetical protein